MAMRCHANFKCNFKYISFHQKPKARKTTLTIMQSSIRWRKFQLLFAFIRSASFAKRFVECILWCLLFQIQFDAILFVNRMVLLEMVCFVRDFIVSSIQYNEFPILFSLSLLNCFKRFQTVLRESFAFFTCSRGRGGRSVALVCFVWKDVCMCAHKCVFLCKSIEWIAFMKSTFAQERLTQDH